MKPVWTALLTGVLISVTTCESVWAQATAQISVGVPAGSNRARSGVPKQSGVSGRERKPDRAQPSVNGGPHANKRRFRIRNDAGRDKPHLSL